MNENGNNESGRWEEQINALLDGELGPEEAESLKAAATEDQVLAREIIEAYQLQQAMEGLRPESAPASLRRKLKKIPRQHAERPVFLQPRWAAAFAVVRDWPGERFARVMEVFARREDVLVVMTGSPGEHEYTETVRTLVPEPARERARGATAWS